MSWRYAQMALSSRLTPRKTVALLTNLTCIPTNAKICRGVPTGRHDNGEVT